MSTFIPPDTPKRLPTAKFLEEPLPVAPGQRLMKAKEVARKLRSFEHFIYVWGVKGKYFLPPKSVLTWHFVSQVLSGEKKLLRADRVGHVLELPKVRGVQIADLWQKYSGAKGLADHFPDMHDSHNIHRNYFFNASSLGP